MNAVTLVFGEGKVHVSNLNLSAFLKTETKKNLKLVMLNFK